MNVTPTSITLQELVSLVSGESSGDPTLILTGVASLDEAGPGDVSFAESARYLHAAGRSGASVVLAPRGADFVGPPIPVWVENPRASFVLALERFAPRPAPSQGIHHTAVVAEGVEIGDGAEIGPYCTVEEGARIGVGARIGARTHIGAHTTIGDNSILHAGVTLYPRVTIGRNCILHSGCVIGADGFGYVPVGGTLKKTPHLGTVVIEDEVEIGANCCIDRAKTGATVIGFGTKLDNLVHVGHNVTIGCSCLLVAQVGIAGSTRIGNGVILAGQSGVADHLTVGDGSRVGAQSGVIGNLAPGSTVLGFPARPHSDKMREFAATARLPEYVKRLRSLEERVAAAEARDQVDRQEEAP